MMTRTPYLRGALCIIAALLVVAGVLLLAFPPLAHSPRYLGLLMQPAPASLPVPVAGAGPAGLADTWGAARSGGRHHEGIDIFARRNTPVMSATDGFVEKVGWDPLGGRVVRIMGPGGYHHYYAHLERFATVRVGDVVRRGRVIGYVGDSGNAKGTPTHLHYGIYRFAGGAINPYPLLVRGTARQAPRTRTVV